MLQLDNFQLPFREELIAQLPRINDDGGWYLGTWRELGQRTQCEFCLLVVIAVSDSIGPENNQSIDLDQNIDIFLFPDEHSFRLSYPSRLGTRIAFVNDDRATARGPDTARIVSPTGIDTTIIKNWLHTCDTKHKCRPEPVTKKENSVRLQHTLLCFEALLT